MRDNLIKVLKEKIDPYKLKSYTILLQKTSESDPIFFENGNFGSSEFFQGEIIFALDDNKSRDIRIIGEINDGKNIKINYNVIVDCNGKVISEGLY